MKWMYMLLLTVVGGLFINAHSPHLSQSEQLDPTVFEIERNVVLFEKLSLEYDSLLFTACDNDFKVALNKWTDLLKQMERNADRLGYDIDGVKLWLKVFWNEKGEIDYIAYSFKPSSKYVDAAKFSRFMEYFRRKYRPNRLRTKFKYSHYAGVAFPAF